MTEHERRAVCLAALRDLAVEPTTEPAGHSDGDAKPGSTQPSP